MSLCYIADCQEFMNYPLREYKNKALIFSAFFVLQHSRKSSLTI
jgi:hypothetical protein